VKDINLLQNIPLFKNLTENELEKILQLAFVKEYKKGFTLFFQGMQGGVMYVILRGSISIIGKDKDGGEHEIVVLRRGDYLGEMSMIEEERRSATARVSEDALLLVITKKCFSTMLETDPSITSKLLLEFLITMSQRLRNTTTMLNEIKKEKEG